MSDCIDGPIHAIAVETLKTRAQFVNLRSQRRFRSSLFTIQSGTGDAGIQPYTCRVGYTVTTKTGNSVERNRIKRRLRAAVAQVFPLKADAGRHYAIIARRDCLYCDFSHITGEMNRALDHLAVNKAKVSRLSDVSKPETKH